MTLPQKQLRRKSNNLVYHTAQYGTAWPGVASSGEVWQGEVLANAKKKTTGKDMADNASEGP